MSKNFDSAFDHAGEDIQALRGMVHLLKEVLTVEEIVSISQSLNEIAATIEFARARHEEHLRAVLASGKKRRNRAASPSLGDFEVEGGVVQEDIPF